MAMAATQTMTTSQEEGYTTLVLQKRPEFLQKSDIKSKFMDAISGLAPSKIFSQEEEEEKEAPTLGDNPQQLDKWRKRFSAKKNEIKKKIDKQLEEMQNQFEQELPNMTEEEAEQAFTWWSAVSDFFSEVMQMFANMIKEVIDKIKEGYKWIKQKMKDALEYLKQAIKQIFG